MSKPATAVAETLNRGEILNGLLSQAIQTPEEVQAEACRRSLFTFVQVFWSTIIQTAPVWNWHIAYLCRVIQDTITRAAQGLPKEHDVLINIPPGTTKSTLVTQMAPAWAWTRWAWLRFICGSYSGDLSTEHGGLCKDIVESAQYRALFPDIKIRVNHDARSNFRIADIKTYNPDTQQIEIIRGGQRTSCSVGGTVTGKHAHVILVDDPLNPKQAASEIQTETANNWLDSTLSTRKVDKAVVPTIQVMQRLAENDCSGHWLQKDGKRLLHICLPGFIRDDRFKSDAEEDEGPVEYEVTPAILKNYYKDNLLDPVRMPWDVIDEMYIDFGPLSFAGQVGQDPSPPEGGMFKINRLRKRIVDVPPFKIKQVVRYWDKAGTEGGGAFTAGGQLAEMENGGFLIMHMVKGQWGPDTREAKMRQIADNDGPGVRTWVEQEPGSGGKDSTLSSIRNLVGHAVYADRPTGDKVVRADPLAAQVNIGNVWMLRGDWNEALLDEMRLFPLSKYKDQIDSLSGAYAKLLQGRRAGALRTQAEISMSQKSRGAKRKAKRRNRK